MRSPRVSAPWQMNRAPPGSATSARWSGDRNPAGGECSVVNETISPAPSSSTDVIATGSRGQKGAGGATVSPHAGQRRSEEHTSELQSQSNLVCRLLLEKKKKKK